MVQIAVRNRFEKGDILELISPHTTVTFNADNFYSINGEPLEVAHGGGEDILISIPGSVYEYSLIRKPILS